MWKATRRSPYLSSGRCGDSLCLIEWAPGVTDARLASLLLRAQAMRASGIHISERDLKALEAELSEGGAELGFKEFVTARQRYEAEEHSAEDIEVRWLIHPPPPLFSG